MTSLTMSNLLLSLVVLPWLLLAGLGAGQDEENCQVADVIFVLDSSGSIGDANWPSVLNFTKNIVEAFDVGQDLVRFGLNYYGNEARLGFHLNTYNTKAEVLAAIDAVPWLSQNTNTSGGIRHMHRDMFKEEYGARDDVSRIAIVITDGESTFDKNLTIPEANVAREKGITLFAIGIGDATSQTELEGIANKPSDKFVFNAESFDALDVIKQAVVETTCLQVATLCSASLDLVFLVDSSDSVCDGSRLVNNRPCLNWVIIKDFMVRTVETLSPTTRVAVVIFSNSGYLQWQLDTYPDKEDLIQAIQDLPYVGSGTNLYEGFRVVEQLALSPARGERSSAANVVILITDGLPSVDVHLAPAQAARVKRISMVFGVVVGIYARSQFAPYVTATGQSHLSIVGTYQSLASYPVEPLVGKVCAAENQERQYGECGGTDLVFLVDRSGSICAEQDVTSCSNWHLMTLFMRSLVDYFSVGLAPDQSRVALVTFDNYGKLQWNFTQYTDPLDLDLALANLPYEAQKRTNTYDGLRITKGLLDDAFNGAVVILTDGRPTDVDAALAEANEVQQVAKVISVGISSESPGHEGVNTTTLRKLSSLPRQENVTYFEVARFEDLTMLAEQLIERTCDNIVCEKPLDLVFLVDSSDSICPECWEAMKNLMIRVIQVLSDDTRVGVVVFSNEAMVVWDLNTYSTKNELIDAVTNNLNRVGGPTNLYRGLVATEQTFYTAAGGRPEVPNVVALLTDGLPNRDVDLTLAQASRLQQIATVFGVVTGPYQDIEFRGYVSAPAANYILIVDDAEELNSVPVETWVKAACGVINKERADGSCGGVDLVYLVDTSGSICADQDVTICDNWYEIRFFLRDLASYFDIGLDKDQSRIALITFGNKGKLQWDFTEYPDSESLDVAIVNLEYVPLQNTNTAEGLDLAYDLLEDKETGAVVILTDGKPTDRPAALEAAVRLQEKAEVVAVGVASGTPGAEGVDAETLRLLSSEPRELNKNYFQVPDFGELWYISESLKNATCIRGCSEPVDVCFLVDRSSSIWASQFALMKDALRLIVEELDVDSGRSRVCLISYADTVDFTFSLNSYSTSSSVLDAINALRYTGGSTDTAGALDMAVNQAFQSANGDRPDVPNVLVVLTDGGSSDKSGAIISAVEAKKKATVLVVGIGGWVDLYEMQSMASHPYSANYWPIQRYEDLTDEAFTMRIRDFVCSNTNPCVGENPCRNGGQCINVHGSYYCDCPAQYPGPNCEGSCLEPCNYVFAVDASGSIGRSNFMTYMDFVKGVILNLPVGKGANVGLLTFSDDAVKVFDMNTYSTMPDMMDGISTAYFNDGKTNTAAGINMMRTDMFTEANGMDPSSCNIGIVITDGRSRDHLQTWAEAVSARDQGIQLLAVGIGRSLDMSELHAIASYPPEQNTFTVDRLEDIDSLVSVLSETACNNEDSCQPTSECQNSGQCRDLLNGFYCECPDGYTHKYCESNCDGQLDIVYAIDRSGSIRRERFQTVQEMLMETIDNLETWNDKVRVAVIAFDDTASVEFHFNTYNHKQDYMEALRRISYNENGRTNIADAINKARTSVFQEQNGDRPGVQNVIVLFSDGAANIDPELVIPEATRARIEGALVIAAAVGNDICMPELRTIVSQPSDSHIYAVESFEDIFSLTNQIMAGTCNDVDECANAPCVNGGQCVDLYNAYQCGCPFDQGGQNCERASCRRQYDIAVVLDTSGSVGELFDLLLPFLKRLVYCQEFRFDRSRMALVSFSDNAEVKFNLETYQSQQEILEAIKFAKTGGRTNTQEALTVTYDEVLWGPGSRPTVDKKVILFTDGGSNVQQANTIPAANALKSRGAEIHVVAVGDSVDMTEVDGLSSGLSYVINVPTAQDVNSAATSLCDDLCQ